MRAPAAPGRPRTTSVPTSSVSAAPSGGGLVRASASRAARRGQRQRRLLVAERRLAARVLAHGLERQPEDLVRIGEHAARHSRSPSRSSARRTCACSRAYSASSSSATATARARDRQARFPLGVRVVGQPGADGVRGLAPRTIVDRRADVGAAHQPLERRRALAPGRRGDVPARRLVAEFVEVALRARRRAASDRPPPPASRARRARSVAADGTPDSSLGSSGAGSKPLRRRNAASTPVAAREFGCTTPNSGW